MAAKKTWTGFVQFDGCDVSIFGKVTFPVTAKQYEAIEKAIQEEIPLRDLSIYEKLCDSAESAFDLEAALGLDEDRPEKPMRKDFDDSEEYQAALDEYEEELECYEEGIEDDLYEYSLEDVTIEDPTELKLFKRKFVGRHLKAEELSYCHKTDDGNFESSLGYEENSNRIVKYDGRMIISPEGEVLDICDISAEALECEDIKSSTYSECAPDYDFLAETLEEAWEWED
jgi:hypothetical protein